VKKELNSFIFPIFEAALLKAAKRKYMALDIGTLAVKAQGYKKVLENTVEYRKAWASKMKPLIIETLEEILKLTDIKGKITIEDKIDNLEAVILDLGKSSSGIHEILDDTNIKRTMVKSNGALIYQQLFNGKVMIMMVSPYIEGYGEPKPPKPLEILRPEELKTGFIIRHMETFLKEITEWEDYDDDEPAKKDAFTPIGFNKIIDQVD
jgi:hypothetical protein